MIAMKYVVIAFYKFFPIEEPLVLKDAFQRKCKASGIVGSIIISPEGINGTVSGQKDGVRNLIKFLHYGLMYILRVFMAIIRKKN